jgi:hypothetical protein
MTLLFYVALPWFLWTIWRAAERADQEVETLALRHRFAHATHAAGGETSNSGSSRTIGY